jgi:hypothetical protein
MNRKTDIDQILRGWLDHGLETPRERDVRAALKQIDTTRQRGARWVWLDERIMRAQPYVSIAAIVAVAAIGLAVWIGMTGAPNVGEPDVTQTPLPGAYETKQFFEPFSVVLPNDWEVIDTTNAVVFHPPGALGERIVIFRAEAATVWGGLDDGYVPWPDDLVAWLEDHPVVTERAGRGSLDVNVRSDTDITVGGEAARLIDASYNFFADRDFAGSMTFISLGLDSPGTNAEVFGRGGPFPLQFVVVAERGIAIFHETQSSASETRFLALLDSIRFSEP